MSAVPRHRSLRLWWEGLVAIVVFVLATVVTVLAAVPAQLVALTWDPHRRVAAGVTRWTWGVGHFFCQPFWRVRVTGRERLAGPACIVVANHQSVLDIPLLMHLPVPVRFGARGGVFRMPLFGAMARFGRHLVLAEDADLDGVVARVRALLADGIHVVVFPEGTRSDGHTLAAFKRGAFELAIRCGADVLPVCVRGTADAAPPGAMFPRAAGPRFHVQVLPRLPSAGHTRRTLAREATTAIAAALAAPDPFGLSARVFDRYRATGRVASGYAFGKTAVDPIFWAAWERLPREGLVVDVGCGEGLLGAYLHACGSAVRVWGVDVDAERVARAAVTASPGDAYRVGDARTVVLPGDAAAVTCFDTLHYLTADEQAAVVGRMIAALAPGGVLLVREAEPGQGWTSRWTAASERVFVWLGRHQGERVVVAGAARLAALLDGPLTDVRVEDASVGPFANRLVWGRKPLRDTGPAR